MNSGPPRCRCVDGLDLVRGQVVRAEAAVGAHDVEGGALAARADGQDARGGLDVVAPHEQSGVHAVALEQGEQHVAGGVGADRAGAPDRRAQLRQDERGAARRAGGRDPDLLDELAALSLGDRLHRAHEHVEHVHAGAQRPHLDAHVSSSTLRVVPYPRASAASITAWRSSSPSALGSPIAAARQ